MLTDDQRKRIEDVREAAFKCQDKLIAATQPGDDRDRMLADLNDAMVAGQQAIAAEQ